MLLRTIALGAAALLVGTLTLLPVHTTVPPEGVALSLTGVRDAADVIANVLLFIPFGVAAALRLRGWRGPILAGAALSFGIELAQLAIPGRYTSPFDVAFNVLGVAAGTALVRTATTWMHPPRIVARLLGAGFLAAALVVLIGGAALFSPAVTSAPLYGQWTAVFRSMEPYDGRVRDAHVGSLDIPSHRIEETVELRRLLLERAPVRVDFRAGPPPHGLAPIFSIYDEDEVEILLIGAERDDIVFRHRMRASVLHLDEPHIRVQHALASVRPGEDASLELRMDGAGLCVRVDGHETRRRCGLGFTVADTWALLLFPVPRSMLGLLRILWPAALLVPVGFYLRSSPVLVVTAAAFAVLAVLAAPAWIPVLPTPPTQAAAVALGFACGMLLGRWIDRRAWFDSD